MRAWCINADGHPGFADDYPDPMRHIPAYECRSAGLFLDAADGLTGNSCELDAYLARPYRFGELRSVASVDETRVVFDYFGAATDTTARFSVSLGDALRLALHLLCRNRRRMLTNRLPRHETLQGETTRSTKGTTMADTDLLTITEAAEALRTPLATCGTGATSAPGRAASASAAASSTGAARSTTG